MSATDKIIKSIFGDNYHFEEKSHIIFGEGTINNTVFHLIGVQTATYLGCEEALTMAEKLLAIAEKGSKQPILLLVDVAGQALSMRDEWLGMEQYFAHLLSILDLLREQGNRLISLVCNEAIGGAFIAYGLMADTIIALPEAKVAVMWLEGVAKITKVPLATLEDLSTKYPVFAPGIENFYKLGGIHEIVPLTDMPAALIKAASAQDDTVDQRAKLGLERLGRKLTWPVIQKILDEIHAKA